MVWKMLKWGSGILLLMMVLSFSGCIDTSKWRPKDYDRPPSWENDYGRPDRDW